MKNRVAAIDIGTNTLLMVIGEKAEGQVQILRDEHAIARLGEGVDAQGNIAESAIERAMHILQSYRLICKEFQVGTIRAIATSAMRDAANRDHVRSQLSQALDSEIEIISGQEEARLSFLGTVETDELCTVIDIGGGSTEYITGCKRDILQRTSLQMGAVRFTERFFSDLPPLPGEIDAARSEIQRKLSELEKEKRGVIIGVGGTWTTCAAMALRLQEFQSEKVHHYPLQLQDISTLSAYAVSHTLADLRSNPAIHPKRADILPMGILIAEESLRYFEKDYCIVSTKGLRYGILLDTCTL